MRSVTCVSVVFSCSPVVIRCCGVPVLSFPSSAISWHSVGVCMGSLSSGLSLSWWKVYAFVSSWGGWGGSS